MTKALMIAAAESGAGKTSVTIALAAALVRRGLKVQCFKVGPDYLDPSYLSLVTGRSCYNLDPWMTGADYARALFLQEAAGADVAVVEGVMGLYDGANAANSEGSSADLARLLGLPVFPVLDAGGMARTFAALVKGLATFESGVTIGGVIANRCGSDRHAAMLSDALASASLPELVGSIPRSAFPTLESRHLGLHTADEKILSSDVIERFAEAGEKHLRINDWLAKSAIVPAGAHVPAQGPAKSRPVRIGLARDEAFHFYYPDNLEALERAGAVLVPFSPIRDVALPADLAGLYFGGGYPEAHAAALATNASLMAEIAAFAKSGRIIYAECGGMMYLSQEIETLDGAHHRLVGLLPFGTRMLKARKRLGYVEAHPRPGTLWGEGGPMRGHEYHYSEIVDERATANGIDRAYDITYRRASAPVGDGFSQGNLLASYVHLHFASHPERVAALVERCRRCG